MSNTNSSFYSSIPNYAADFPNQNDTNTKGANTATPSSFYPNGGVYAALANGDNGPVNAPLGVALFAQAKPL